MLTRIYKDLDRRIELQFLEFIMVWRYSPTNTVARDEPCQRPGYDGNPMPGRRYPFWHAAKGQEAFPGGCVKYEP
jgi:hypothetical protein